MKLEKTGNPTMEATKNIANALEISIDERISGVKT